MTSPAVPAHAYLDLPDVIRRYQDAHDRHDADVALSAFATDATVIDDGRTMHGREEIRRWLATVATEFTFTRTFIGAERSAAEASATEKSTTEMHGAEKSGADTTDTDASGADTSWLVRNRLEGDFPGGVADLRYRFTLSGDRISRLVIAP